MADYDTPKGKVGPVTTSAASGSGISGASGILIVYLASLAGLEIPTEVAGAIVLLLSAVGSLVGGKVVRPKD